MSERPAVSVLLPVRDGLPFLGEALASLSAQTFGDFEIVAVDDGSTDGSREVLASHGRSEPRLRVVAAAGRGLVAALNSGLAACRAPWIARMDADDRCHPERLERQLGRVRADPSVDVVSCRVRHFPEEEVAEGFRVYERWLNRLIEHDDIVRERFIESPLPHPSVLMRRRLLAAVGGYRDLDWPEDHDLWLRLAARGARFAKVPETLLFWRDHPDRLTRTDDRYRLERFLRLKAHHLARGPLAAARRVLLWGAGPTGRRLAKHLAREGSALAGFIDIDPAKIGRTLRRLPIVAFGEVGRPEPGAVVVTAVSSRGARALIRARLARSGWVEGEDFWCAA